MENVIQKYLRNQYASIEEYNAQAGSIAEKYHFLVIASFPVNFSDTAARRRTFAGQIVKKGRDKTVRGHVCRGPKRSRQSFGLRIDILGVKQLV